MQRERTTILGAYEETPVYRAEAPTDGPTVVVVGGLHGNETTSPQAANLIRLWSISRGTLIVIPEANRPAVEAGTRQATQYDQPDMNRQFPTGAQPTHGIARGVWRVITDNDADYVIDLHRSKGLYRRSPSGVGMAIFPTPSGGSTSEKSLRHLNVGHVPNPDSHAFKVGNDQTGANNLLSHKVGGDLDPGTVGWLVETTYHEQSAYVQRDQLEHAVEALLYHCGSGIRVTDYGHNEHDPKKSVLDAYAEDPDGEESTDDGTTGLSDTDFERIGRKCVDVVAGALDGQ